MNAITTTPVRVITQTAVQALDLAAQATAWALSKFTSITDAGAFWVTGGQSFWDAWTEEGQSGRGSLIIRLGRLELGADWKG
ncbi:MAG: hypothetical protein Q7U28_02660 [Aquabacterium sp.]|nr:hypothetical protein [Aquabacterium sp.]